MTPLLVIKLSRSLLCLGLTILVTNATLIPEMPLASPYRGWQIDSVHFEGISNDLADQLEPGLAVAIRTGFLNMGRTNLAENMLEEDSERIRFFLARNGFPRATVTTNLEPIPEKKQLRVIFEIIPGPEFLIDNLSVEGAPPGLDLMAEVVAGCHLSGSRFSDKAVNNCQDQLTQFLMNQGFAFAEATTSVKLTTSNRVQVTYLVTAQNRYRFDSVSVEGIPSDLKPLARRTMNVKPGTLYNSAIATRARDRLRDLRLFRQIKIEPRRLDSLSLELFGDLKPSPPRTARLSVGSWSDDPWRVSALWRHRNLLRCGRGFEASGAYSRYGRQIRASVWWPALLTPNSRTDLSLRYDIEDEDAYYLTDQTIELSNLFRFGFSTSLRIAASLGQVDVEPRSGELDDFTGLTGRQFYLQGRWVDEVVDNLLSPSAGYRHHIGLLWSPANFISSAPFWSARAQAIRYIPLSKKWVVAGRIGLGIAGVLGQEKSLLPNHRFFAGGVTTQRGYRRRQLGPVATSGDPIGGEARVLVSTELRFPLYRFVGGALFVDSGQVWLQRKDLDLAELDVAAGFGLLFSTPIGPVRIDLAVNSSPPRDLPEALVQIAIGHPY